MSKMRMLRVQELIKETLGDILLKIKDPRIGFVTITDVRVAPDLDSAHVYVSILGSREEQDNSIKGLESASGFIRHELGNKIRLRKIPRIIFEFDPGIERGIKMISLIDRVVHHEPEDGQQKA